MPKKNKENCQSKLSKCLLPISTVVNERFCQVSLKKSSRVLPKYFGELVYFTEVYLKQTFYLRFAEEVLRISLRSRVNVPSGSSVVVINWP